MGPTHPGRTDSLSANFLDRACNEAAKASGPLECSERARSLSFGLRREETGAG